MKRAKRTGFAAGAFFAVDGFAAGVTLAAGAFAAGVALAAAALDQAIDPATGQALDPIEVANNYMDSVHMPYNVTFNTVAEINSATERKINITADASIGTFFLKVAGANSLAAELKSTGYEKYALVEVSLVLDISGSMGSSTKIDAMKTAASNFVSTMLAGNSSSSPNLVSINLIPYSAYVNMGEGFFTASGMTGGCHDRGIGYKDIFVAATAPVALAATPPHKGASGRSHGGRRPPGIVA